MPVVTHDSAKTVEIANDSEKVVSNEEKSDNDIKVLEKVVESETNKETQDDNKIGDQDSSDVEKHTEIKTEEVKGNNDSNDSKSKGNNTNLDEKKKNIEKIDLRKKIAQEKTTKKIQASKENTPNSKSSIIASHEDVPYLRRKRRENVQKERLVFQL